MAVLFVVKPEISEPAVDTVTITDGSNYDTNTEGITAISVLSRSVEVTDSLGHHVATVVLSLQLDGTYAGSMIKSKDFFYTYVLTITLPASVIKTGTTTYVMVQHYNASFIQIMQNNLGDCGCKNGNICSDLTWSMHNKNAAIIFASKQGMGQLSQQSIDVANQFVNNILNG